MLAAFADCARVCFSSHKARTAAMIPLLVSRDRLLPASEWAFMRRQYGGFTRLSPQWVGCRRDEGLAGSEILDPILIEGGIAPALFKQFGRIPASLKALKPALVHAQFGKGGALALPLAQFWNVPLVVTFHGGDAFKESHYRKQLFPSVFQRRWSALVERASLFVCVSEGVRDKLIERGVPSHKLEVIVIGTDTILPEFPIAPSPEHVLFVGRFVEKKGIFIFIEAIKNLRSLGISTPVVLAGSGPLLTEAQNAASGLSDVRFTGWQSAEQVQTLISRSYALVVPSIAGQGGDAEGLPSVAVEAMGLAVPVIASDAAGLMGIAGKIVPAGDALSLAAAMADTVAHPSERASMAYAAYALACNHFSALKQSQRLEDRLLSFIDHSEEFRP